MVFSRTNELDQALDIAGSYNQQQNLTISEEAAGYGPPISGQTGATASISAFSSNVITFIGLTGMTLQSVGRFLTVSGAASAGNNGTFLIVAYNSATSVNISNTGGIFPDANSGSITWTERKPYTLEDDINYIRSDRKLIKGTTNWYDNLPNYQRPTAIGTNVPANLSNISGKTTDAQGFIFPRWFRNSSVNLGNTFITITSAGNLKHSNSVDKTGVPCFDVAPYTGNYNACYVLLTNPTTDGQLIAQGGAADGYIIFGISRNGSSSSPNSVEVTFYAMPHGTDVSNSIPYTWDSAQPNIINLTYGYFLRLDQADENAFRQTIASGGGSGSAMPVPTEVGQFLYSVNSDNLAFTAERPLINDDGFIMVNDDDQIMVV